MHAANRSIFGEPARAGSLVDPGSVTRALGSGDHREQAPTQPLPQPVDVTVEIQRQTHTRTVRGPVPSTPRAQVPQPGDRVPGPAGSSRY